MILEMKLFFLVSPIFPLAVLPRSGTPGSKDPLAFLWLLVQCFLKEVGTPSTVPAWVVVQGIGSWVSPVLVVYYLRFPACFCLMPVGSQMSLLWETDL